MVAFPGGGRLVNNVGSSFVDPFQKDSPPKTKPKNNLTPREAGTVVSANNFRLTANSQIVNNQSSIILDWDAVPDVADGYIVERTNDGVNWINPPTNYGKRINILNVYPVNGNFLKSWMDQIDPSTGQPVSMGLINIIPVALSDFITNPDGYLKDASGNYKYDGIYFGSSDGNNNEDINTPTVTAVKNFGRTGRSVIFGHDTVMSAVHPYFNNFASELGIRLLPNIDDMSQNDDRFGSNVVKFSDKEKNGYLAKYPYLLDPDAEYHIQPSHTGGQFYLYSGGGTRWMEYLPPYYIYGSSGVPTVEHYLDTGGNRAWSDNGQRIGDNNAYLITKNNYAVIQTGHTTGACTPDEAKIIANMVYFTSTLNTTTHGEDHTVKDSSAPNVPQITTNSFVNDQLVVNVNTADNPTNYFYRIKAKTSTADKYSDLVKVPILSGFKGYVYSIDNNPVGSPTVNKNSSGEVTNINLNPTSATDNHGNITFNRNSDAGRYLHIVAVDKADNVSAVKTVSISDYFWWKYETGTLTIYPHQLNATVDTTTQDWDSIPGIFYRLWPWEQYRSDITKVVINPGVSAVGNMSHFFYNFNNLTSIEGLTNLDTSQVTSFDSFFSKCYKLTSIDVSHFDTRNCIDMSLMFNEMMSLTNLDVSHFITTKVTNMRAMFQSATSLTQLVLNNFNTSSVVDMGHMFNNDHLLKKIDMSSFNTSNVEIMMWMFGHLDNITSLDLSNFDTSKVTTVYEMFKSDPKLWKLKLGPNTKLYTGEDLGLDDPNPGTQIDDLDNPTPVYYATNKQWREALTPTSVHAPTGAARTALQIINDSRTRHDVRTYVWDQVGTQTLTSTPGSIDLGTHAGYLRNKEYVSAAQNLKITDNRNVRTGKRWHVEAAVTNPFKLTTDSTKVIRGNPLYYRNTTTGAVTHLLSTAQTLHSEIATSNYQDIKNYPWSLRFKASPSDIPKAGRYNATVTFTLVNDTP
ncbi:BspA family leucine-rich repeat surface protein [Xylocopilactobacillus apis]|uniref:Surface protein n=1 Tax=Xylocopilactobacillus apis TaxID=2932183 RepID=A0AAU9DFA8_9LACO|nr:BspA family leucine-rich repeat surface protein [Xylocopilactobacillus apis]BDR56926.1 hypothetical protein KIMC2_14880 [Xylocopilactobacillus apis]